MYLCVYEFMNVCVYVVMHLNMLRLHVCVCLLTINSMSYIDTYQK